MHQTYICNCPDQTVAHAGVAILSDMWSYIAWLAWSRGPTGTTASCTSAFAKAAPQLCKMLSIEIFR